MIIDDGSCVVSGRLMKSRSKIHMHQQLIAPSYVPAPTPLHWHSSIVLGLRHFDILSGKNEDD